MSGKERILWGAVARSGKTFMSAYFIDQLKKIESSPIKPNKILILTPFPTETI